jgi:hypothetical protein
VFPSRSGKLLAEVRQEFASFEVFRRWERGK